jgi:hypothetical protein
MSGHSNRYERPLLWLILLFAAVFRFYPFGTVSLSNDELSALIRTRYPSFGEMVRNGVYTDFHPAGVQSFLYGWTCVIGEDAFLLRLPFILLGLGSIWLIYRLGRRWFHPAAGLLAAALFSVLEFSIIYSQLARPYAPGVFFCLLASWYWTILTDEAKQGQVRWRTWIPWVISMAVCAHLHYFTFVYAGALGLSGIVLLNGRLRGQYLLSGLLVLLLALPEWSVFREQLKTGDLGGWLGKPEKTWLFAYFFNAFNTSWLLIDALIVCFFTGWYVQRSRPEWNRYHALIAFIFFFSFGLAFGYSLLRHPIIQFSTLFFVFPLVLLFFFSFTPSAFRQGAGLIGVVLLVLIGGTLSTAMEKKFFRMPAYGVFRELTVRAHEWSGDAQHPAWCIFNVINPDYLEYYFAREGWRPDTVVYGAEKARELAVLGSALDSLKPGSIIYGWTNSFHPEELYFLLRERYERLDRDEAYFNARISRFSKGTADWPVHDPRAMTWDYEDGPSGTDFPDSLQRTGKGERLDAGVEFSHTLTCSLDSLRPGRYDVLNARCRFMTGVLPVDARLVLSVERDRSNLGYFSAAINDWNVRPGRWQEAVISGVVPEGCTGATVKAYVWNKGAASWWIDDLALVLTPAPFPYEKP